MASYGKLWQVMASLWLQTRPNLLPTDKVIFLSPIAVLYADLLCLNWTCPSKYTKERCFSKLAPTCLNLPSMGGNSYYWQNNPKYIKEDDMNIVDTLSRWKNCFKVQLTISRPVCAIGCHKITNGEGEIVWRKVKYNQDKWKERSMCNDTMKVGTQSRLVKGRESFKVIHNQDQWRNCSMCNDTMNVAIQSQLVMGRKGVKVEHNQNQWRKCSICNDRAND